ncbi:hypothetical protein [Streptomyces sp. NPDC002785]|uniref:hypothetical protein n=1 Tax=Streptomyces sp. NPDC002785 TaxID=3154543 RepID=UPI00332C8C13
MADLPPMVMSDLFGIHPKTAECWAAFTGGSWIDYLAIVQTKARQEESGLSRSEA